MFEKKSFRYMQKTQYLRSYCMSYKRQRDKILFCSGSHLESSHLTLTNAPRINTTWRAELRPGMPCARANREKVNLTLFNNLFIN